MPKKKAARAAPDRALAVRLYQAMTLIREAERKIIEIYPTDKIQSPVHLSIGQEGISAGLCLALGPKDRLYGTYRGHGIYIARGGDLGRFYAELYGKDTGCTRGKGGSMHLLAPDVGLMGCSAIVGSMIPVATGDAYASKYHGTPYIVAAVFGDGAVDEGVFYESVNFAVLKKLPVLFVCENNRYAIHSKVSDRHGATKIARYCHGLGLRGVTLDGDDVFKVYETVAKEAEALRKGGGPVLLELMTHRVHEHVGPGSDIEEYYRHPGEKARALRSDPLVRAKAVLKKKFKVNETEFRMMDEAARASVAAAVKFAENSPFPGPERLLADVYAPS